MDFYSSLTHLPPSLVETLQISAEEENTHALYLNLAKMSEEAFLSRFPKVKPHPLLPHAFLYSKSDYEFGKSFYYDMGVYSIQDASSMLPPFYLDPKPGETVLDLCAAPGGKSILLSLLMQGRGILLSNDLSPSRAKSLSSNIERMGLGNVIVCNDDFSRHATESNETFAQTLLDAPCSGSAMFRKSEQSRKEWSEAKVRECALIQAELLEEAYAMLKPGGRLLYSTCSFSYEEDEGALSSFLSKHPDMKTIQVQESPLFYRGKEIPDSVLLLPCLFPGEGQFLCLLEKEGSLEGTSEKYCASKTGFEDLLGFYGLSDRFNFLSSSCLWSLPRFFDTKSLHTLRKGLKVAEGPYFEPDQSLAHYLGADYQVELTSSQALSFCKGETFPLCLGDGYYLASYQGVGIGFFKMAKGKMKNHYPKGLRRQYKEI